MISTWARSAVQTKRLLLACRTCAAAFPFERRLGSPGRLPRFCSDDCRKERFKRRDIEIGCATCGQSFRPRYLSAGDPPSYGKYCSVACRPQCQSVFAGRKESKKALAHRHRAIRRGAGAERFRPIEIFERDGWRCGLCGHRVDRRLRFPDKMSASIDHIIPISQGGSHTRANCQCAHWLCNSRKTSGPGGQLRLFG